MDSASTGTEQIILNINAWRASPVWVRPSVLRVLWRCPTLPQPGGCSTIGAAGLSFQVRNVAGRFPGAMTTTSLGVQHSPHVVWWGVG